MNIHLNALFSSLWIEMIWIWMGISYPYHIVTSWAFLDSMMHNSSKHLFECVWRVIGQILKWFFQLINGYNWIWQSRRNSLVPSANRIFVNFDLIRYFSFEFTMSQLYTLPIRYDVTIETIERGNVIHWNKFFNDRERDSSYDWLKILVKSRGCCTCALKWDQLVVSIAHCHLRCLNCTEFGCYWFWTLRKDCLVFAIKHCLLVCYEKEIVIHFSNESLTCDKWWIVLTFI